MMQISEEKIDVNMNDKGTGDPFNKPIAGQSLVNEPGNIPSERPPDYVDPEEVYAKLSKNFSKPETKEKTLELIAAGLPLEILINTIVKQAAYSGAITPDVAELLKPSLTVFFLDMAKKADVDPIIFADDEDEIKQEELEKDKTLMNTFENQKPDDARIIRGEQFKEDLASRAKVAADGVAARREINRRSEEAAVESDGSFLEMDEG